MPRKFLLVKINVLNAAQLEMHISRFPAQRKNLFLLVEVILPLVLNIDRCHRLRRDNNNHRLALVQPVLNRCAPFHPGGDVGNIDPHANPDFGQRLGELPRKFIVVVAVADENLGHSFRRL